MWQSIVALILLSLCLGAGAWLFFLWATHRGEFDDPEEPKYRMLEDEPPAEAPDEEDRHGD